MGASFRIFWGNVTVNTDPMPYSLSTLIVPPIASSSLCVMTRPSPVPSTVLFRSISRRWNLVKSFSRSSSFIPIPVSLTDAVISSVSLSCFSPRTAKVTYPFSVYLTALLRILVRICLTLTSSPESSSGSDLSTSIEKSSFLS